MENMTKEDIDKVYRNNQSILGFLKAYESVDSDRSGADPEKRISKNTMIEIIMDFAIDNKNILSKYSIEKRQER